MSKNILTFVASTGIQKTKLSRECPFCSIDHLSDVIDIHGEMILLKNKYPTLEKASQLVLIESKKHDGDISNYEINEWEHILKYAICSWEGLLNSGEFKSVLLYKNFGPESGGSQTHPHMQIIGLKNTNGYKNIRGDDFGGSILYQEAGVIANISTYPIMGFFETNIIWNTQQAMPVAARIIQETVKFVLNKYYKGLCNSYNLFFYKIDNQYICKVVPRFVASPYFVGYRIGQKFDDDYVRHIKNEFLKFISNLQEA
ncbi:DUF4931 domain-containing protein [Latilactobacillus fuchuensis]|uniref:Galactose-1-phosphate uridylyltransferase n=1 Tax=Latilactobacillus fuchuensis TaxID=164393 RepID=A0A2N9DTT9_9LACO|nr:DUF4931 domain-containing protein [Latilactobacillus fuchuensis]SPC37036.1 conserved hypothetical protein [Latilactobacillus fuchuensis]